MLLEFKNERSLDMVDGVNIHLSANEAEVFLHNLMYPTEETIEARRNFLQEVENDIRVERINGETIVRSEQIDENAIRNAIRRRKQERDEITNRKETGTIPAIRHTYMSREYSTVFEDKVQTRERFIESTGEKNQKINIDNFAFLIDRTAYLAA